MVFGDHSFGVRIAALCRTEAHQLQTAINLPDPEADSGDADAESHENPFVVETRIVKLPGQGKLKEFKAVATWLNPTSEMLRVANVAKEVGTQLWFNMSKPGEAVRTMNALRLSGKITCCASLLQHLLKLRRAGGTEENPVFDADLDPLYRAAREYWEHELTQEAKKFV